MKIKWIADVRELPGIGVVHKGDIKDVPDHIGRSYVYQGLADKLKDAAQPVKTKEVIK